MAAAPAVLRRLLARWQGAENAVAVTAFAAVALILVADTVGRELVGRLASALGRPAGGFGIDGAYKLAVYAMVIGTCAGIGVATATAAHPVPRVAWHALPSAWSAALDRVADLVTALLLCGAAGYSALMVQGSYEIGIVAPVLQWPVWPVQLALPLGFASAALRYALYAVWPDLRPARVSP